MDYVDGTDAGRLLQDRFHDGMPGADVGEIVAGVADALDYAHQRGLLHRDVKPANVLLANPGTPESRILLADFGIARWVDDSSGLTATNMTVGTVSYAAPEQLVGGDLDGRADQYALAATAFHLLTGVPPFQHSNPAVVISQHLSAAPPVIGDRRPELAALDPVFAKALAKDPKDRYERCADFARALGHRIGGEDSDATRLSAPVAAPIAARRSPLRAGVLVPAVLVVLLVAAVGFGLFELTRADDERVPSATVTATASRVTSPPAPAPPPPPPPPQPTAPPETPTDTSTPTPTVAPAPPAVVIGADCAPGGSTGTTINGATAYCSTLQGTRATIWSLNPGDVPPPTVTIDPTETPLPTEQETPVRVCMQQTGQSRFRCWEDIRRSRGLP
jgi:serine/threonine-protein kinase